jgi:RNA polymerase sigma factor (sigma-70 family)
LPRAVQFLAATILGRLGFVMTTSTGDAGSVTLWLSQLRLGQDYAAQKLWERYYTRLVRLAQKRMSHTPRRFEDEEDVAQSAFATFCANLADGRFPQLHDRHDLWKLLIIITARKATNSVRREKTLKRGGPTVQTGQQSPSPQLEHLIGDEPSPDFALQAAETVRRLLDSLPSPSLRILAMNKLEGYTNEEIADRLGWSLRTVERRLQDIRQLWKQHEG